MLKHLVPLKASPDANSEAGPSGKWEKGTSGNPAGRPRGSRNKATLLMEQLIEDQGPELIQKLIDVAKNGDIRALQLCLDRLVPPRKECETEFEVGPTENHEQIQAAMSRVFEGIKLGRITLNEGERLFAMLRAKFDMVYCYQYK